MATRRRIDRDVLEAIENLVLRGASPPEIERTLARRHDMAARRPSVRTLERIVRDLRADDASGPWRLTPDEPDPAAVLWVLSASERDGWHLPITVREAGWITAIHRCSPAVGPLTTRMLARMYVAAEATPEGTAWLDRALACIPHVPGDPPVDERVRLLLRAPSR